MSLAGEERKQQILNMLQLQGKVHTPELVEKLEVSSETVRRYMEELEQENRLKRVYGGAVKVNVEREEPAPTSSARCCRRRRSAGSDRLLLISFRTRMSSSLMTARRRCR